MEKDIHSSAQFWDKIIHFSNQAPTSMNSLDGLFKSKDKTEAFSHLFSMLGQLNQYQLNKQQSDSTTSDTPSNSSGDSIYNLFDSPSMKEIVKEVMDRRSKRR